MRVIIPCRYCIAFEVMLLFLVSDLHPTVDIAASLYAVSEKKTVAYLILCNLIKETRTVVHNSWRSTS